MKNAKGSGLGGETTQKQLSVILLLLDNNAGGQKNGDGSKTLPSLLLPPIVAHWPASR
jgi:hypothetical protein